MIQPTGQSFWLALCASVLAAAVADPVSSADPSATEVHDARELYAALANAAPGQTIFATAGTYDLDRPLVIPDGVMLSGDGQMQIDADGIASGWATGSVTSLRVARQLDGDVVTLGHGAALRGLRIEQLAGGPAGEVMPFGNVIAILSRRADDCVAVTISDCEIVNPEAFGFNAAGPTGRAIVVLTLHARPPLVRETHLAAHVAVTVERSIVRSGASSSLFANNFASRGRIDLVLRGNRLEGLLGAAGGTTRLDTVTDATTTVESSGNLYVSVKSDVGVGWQLLGGTSAPHNLPRSPGAYRNSLRMHSVNDRIDGFRVAVLAAAGRRVQNTPGPVSDNRLYLTMSGTIIRTTDASGADLSLHGASAESASDHPAIAIGDRNELHARIEGVHGSGPRANVFSNVTGPVLPNDRGHGNRLIIDGDERAFARSNPGIEPLPPQEFWDTPALH